jgi:hypothetical protein
MSREQHAKFITRLRGAKAGEFVWGYWLSITRGYDIEIPATKEAPTAADHAEYVDKGDVFATKAGRRLRFEVKTLSVTFTGPKDWPYPEVFVARVEQVDRAIDDVCAWISLSNDFGAAVRVEPTTRAKWYRTTRINKNTGNEETYYAVKLEDARFMEDLWRDV